MKKFFLLTTILLVLSCSSIKTIVIRGELGQTKGDSLIINTIANKYTFKIKGNDTLVVGRTYVFDLEYVKCHGLNNAKVIGVAELDSIQKQRQMVFGE